MSIEAAVVGPVASALIKSLMAKRGRRVPLMIDCLAIVASMRQAKAYPPQLLWKDAEYLLEKLEQMDDEADIRAGLYELDQSFGGEE